MPRSNAAADFIGRRIGPIPQFADISRCTSRISRRNADPAPSLHGSRLVASMSIPPHRMPDISPSAGDRGRPASGSANVQRGRLQRGVELPFSPLVGEVAARSDGGAVRMRGAGISLRWQALQTKPCDAWQIATERGNRARLLQSLPAPRDRPSALKSSASPRCSRRLRALASRARSARQVLRQSKCLRATAALDGFSEQDEASPDG